MAFHRPPSSVTRAHTAQAGVQFNSTTWDVVGVGRDTDEQRPRQDQAAAVPRSHLQLRSAKCGWARCRGVLGPVQPVAAADGLVVKGRAVMAGWPHSKRRDDAVAEFVAEAEEKHAAQST